MSRTIRELPLAEQVVTGDLFHISGTDLLDKRVTIDDMAVAIRETLAGGLRATDDIIQTAGTASLANGSLVVSSTAVNINKTLTASNGLIVGIGSYAFQAGSLGYTDPNWGFLYRPPRAGMLGSHGFHNYAGQEIFRFTEDFNSVFYNNGVELLRISPTAINMYQPLKVYGEIESTATIRSLGTMYTAYGIGSTDARHAIGGARTADGDAYLDLIGDTAYPTYGLRIIRRDDGTSSILHRGTGLAVLNAQDGGTWLIQSSGQTIQRLSPTGIDMYKPLTVNNNLFLDRIGAGNATSLYMASDNGEYAYIRLMTGTTEPAGARWDIGKFNNAETGGNVGSDFYIHRFSDNGSFLDRPFTIKRDTGNILINQPSDAGYKLDVNGTGRFNGGLTAGSLSIGQGAEIGFASSTFTAVEIGNPSQNGPTYIDLKADSTYTDYGFRFLRNNGDNASSSIIHRGTGLFQLNSQNGGAIKLQHESIDTISIEQSVINMYQPLTVNDNLTVTGLANIPMVRAHYQYVSINLADGIMIFVTKIEDTNNAYSTTTGYYTAPFDGVYQVSISSVSQYADGDLQIYINGALYEYFFKLGELDRRCGTTSVRLSAGDTIGVYSSSAVAADPFSWIIFERISS